VIVHGSTSARDEPNVLKFALPDYGFVSQKYLWSSAFGMQNKAGEFLGYISVNLLIDDLPRLSGALCWS
jgi:hypothetical protein